MSECLSTNGIKQYICFRTCPCMHTYECVSLIQGYFCRKLYTFIFSIGRVLEMAFCSASSGSALVRLGALLCSLDVDIATISSPFIYDIHPWHGRDNQPAIIHPVEPFLPCFPCLICYWCRSRALSNWMYDRLTNGTLSLTAHSLGLVSGAYVWYFCLDKLHKREG